MNILISIVAWLSLMCSNTVVADQESYKALAGKTGVGKTTILNGITNCKGKTCTDEKSCTKEVLECPNHHLDTVGLDDDGKEYEVNYFGKTIKISGLTYPVFSLLEFFEQKKISKVEFFDVRDANNVRGGHSCQFFTSFLQDELKCSVTRVLNKFRPENHDHMKRKQPGDILIGEFPTEWPQLNGEVCEFGLDPKWRTKVVETDLVGVRSKIDLTHCRELLQRKKDFEAAMNKPPQAPSTKHCGYEAVVGYSKSGGWSVDLGFAKFGKEGKSRPITEIRVNPECARFEEEVNKAIREANQSLQDEKVEYLKIMTAVDEQLNKCRQLPNFEL